MATLAAMWRGLPVVPRAILTGLAVSSAGTVPWVVLAGLNSKLVPTLPWSAAVMSCYLWLYWRWLKGSGWPRTSAPARRTDLHAGVLSGRLWRWSLLALALGFGSVISIFVVVSRLIRIGFRPLPDVSAYPLASVIGALITSALVAGVVEEAAFRGFMQGPIERRHGPRVAAFIVAIVFSLTHLTHGFLPAYLLANAAASVALSAVVSLAGSIRPGIVIHAASDILVPFWMWSRRGHAPAPLVWELGPDGAFWLQGLLAVLAAGTTVWAYRRLAVVARSEEEARPLRP